MPQLRCCNAAGMCIAGVNSSSRTRKPTYVHEILHLALLEALLERALLSGCETVTIVSIYCSSARCLDSCIPHAVHVERCVYVAIGRLAVWW